jgi:hypothetical protein
VLHSISAYYHTGAVVALEGILVALAVFLFTYRGYDNPSGRRDRIAAVIAATAAVFVAAFPGHVPDGVLPPEWWTKTIGTIHNGAAAILFCAFIFFCLVQFPMTATSGAPMTRGKKVRNLIYRACGGLMVICIAWAGIGAYKDWPIFWPEALALEFFAASWLVKGRAETTAAFVGRRTLHYGRHPGELADKVVSVIRGKHRTPPATHSEH